MEYLMAIALLCQTSTSDHSIETISRYQTECHKNLIKCVEGIEGPFTKELKLSDCVKNGAHK